MSSPHPHPHPTLPISMQYMHQFARDGRWPFLHVGGDISSRTPYMIPKVGLMTHGNGRGSGERGKSKSACASRSEKDTTDRSCPRTPIQRSTLKDGDLASSVTEVKSRDLQGWVPLGVTIAIRTSALRYMAVPTLPVRYAIVGDKQRYRLETGGWQLRWSAAHGLGCPEDRRLQADVGESTTRPPKGHRALACLAAAPSDVEDQ